MPLSRNKVSGRPRAALLHTGNTVQQRARVQKQRGHENRPVFNYRPVPVCHPAEGSSSLGGIGISVDLLVSWWQVVLCLRQTMLALVLICPLWVGLQGFKLLLRWGLVLLWRGSVARRQRVFISMYLWNSISFNYGRKNKTIFWPVIWIINGSRYKVCMGKVKQMHLNHTHCEPLEGALLLVFSDVPYVLQPVDGRQVRVSSTHVRSPGRWLGPSTTKTNSPVVTCCSSTFCALSCSCCFSSSCLCFWRSTAFWLRSSSCCTRCSSNSLISSSV